MNKVTKRRIFDSIVWAACLLAVFGVLVHDARAESRAVRATNATWKSECGSCHVAYPPQFLPASSWQRIMSGLDRHFGTDASLDPAAAGEIGAFLASNSQSGPRAGADAGILRVTETRSFRRKHDEVPAAAWKNAQVKTPANCNACHANADRGDFNEHDVRVPR